MSAVDQPAEPDDCASGIRSAGATILPKYLERFGENCVAEPGMYLPVIDRNRCEGSGKCVRVCPQQVFEVRTIEAADHAMLSFVGRIRSAMHGRKSGYTPHASSCQACGLCLQVCPEGAISLVKLF